MENDGRTEYNILSGDTHVTIDENGLVSSTLNANGFTQVDIHISFPDYTYANNLSVIKTIYVTEFDNLSMEITPYPSYNSNSFDRPNTLRKIDCLDLYQRGQFTITGMYYIQVIFFSSCFFFENIDYTFYVLSACIVFFCTEP